MTNTRVIYKVKSLLGLFESTKRDLEKIPEKHRKRMSRKREYVLNIKSLPVMKYPAVDSNEHKEDLLEVKNCYLNPSLQTGFLNTSSESVESVFKDSQNGIILRNSF